MLINEIDMGHKNVMTIIYIVTFYYTKDNTNKKIEQSKTISFQAKKKYIYQICK